jgi:hypothetical protein
VLRNGLREHGRSPKAPAVLRTSTPEHGRDRESTAVLEKASLKHGMLKNAVVIVTKQEIDIFLSITNLFLPHISPENYRKL